MNRRLIKLVTCKMEGKILHAMEINGTVAVVEKINGEVVFHAREYSKDGGKLTESGGYSTKEKHWYMGERYRSKALWGRFYSEVFK